MHPRFVPALRLRRPLGRFCSAALATAVFGLCAFALSVIPATASTASVWTKLGTFPDLKEGNIWCIANDPTNPDHVIVGTDNGIYESSNNGASWTQSADAGVRVWALSYDPVTPGTLFAGTDGEGILMSSNDGSSWTTIRTGLPSLDVRALAIGLDGDAAGTDNGVAFSLNGTTWTPGGLSGDAVSSLAVAQNDPQFEVMATIDRGKLSTAFLYESMAGSSTWTPITNNLPSGAFGSSVSSGPLTAQQTTHPLVVASSAGVYASNNGGSTWTQGAGIPAGISPVTVTTVVFSPIDPLVVYAGADAGGSSGGGFFRSTDGGNTFEPATPSTNTPGFAAGLPSTKQEVEAIGVTNTNPSNVFVALDQPGTGGVMYRMTDTSAPPPPSLVADSPGAPIPSVVAAPSSTPTPTPSVVRKTSHSNHDATSFFSTVFHWPEPLVFEILILLVLGYVIIRWRQHSFNIEGPP